MRAMLMVDKGRLEMDDVKMPEVQEGWALLRVIVSAAGLFHTQMAKGMLDTKGLPRILGHEIVGEIVEATSPASPPAGTVVVADAVVGCGVCEWCIRGEDSICPWMRHLGIDLDGGFAEYVLVPEANIFRLPDDISTDQAVMLSSALPAAVHGVRRSGIGAGDRVAVSGVGSIGFTLCQVARAFGATTLVASDVSGDQLSAVAPWADETVNVSGMGPEEADVAVRDAVGVEAGFDVVFEAAGHPSSLDTVLKLVRPGGTALLMGICDGPTSLTFQDYLAEFIRREVTLITTFGFTRRDFLVGNSLYSSGQLDLQPLVGPTIALDDIPDVLADIGEHGTGGRRYVVDVGSD